MHFSFQHEVISCLEVTASLKCSHSSPENEDLKRNLVWDCELEYFEINKHWILKIREYSLIDLRDFNILKSYAAKSLQLCLTLCDPIDGSPTGSSVPAIHQTRTLEWVAISFCNAWKWKVKVKSLSRVRLLATPWTAAHQAPPSMGVSRQEYWSGCHCLLRQVTENIIKSLGLRMQLSLFESWCHYSAGAVGLSWTSYLFFLFCFHVLAVMK